MLYTRRCRAKLNRFHLVVSIKAVPFPTVLKFSKEVALGGSGSG